MRLIEALLEAGKDTRKFAISDLGFAIRYNKDRDLMVYCNKETGKYSNVGSLSIWSHENLFSDGWEVKAVTAPKYKIGDKFLINKLGSEIYRQKAVIFNQVYSNVVVKVREYYVKEDKILYTVISEDKGITLVLSEEYLDKLDMVATQNTM